MFSCLKLISFILFLLIFFIVKCLYCLFFCIVWFPNFWSEDCPIGTCGPWVIYSAFLFADIKSTFFDMIHFPGSF